jgi:hypothetical protein
MTPTPREPLYGNCRVKFEKKSGIIPDRHGVAVLIRLVAMAASIRSQDNMREQSSEILVAAFSADGFKLFIELRPPILG